MSGVQTGMEQAMQVRTIVTEPVKLVGFMSANGPQDERMLFERLQARKSEIAGRTGEEEYLVIVPGGLIVAAPVSDITDVPEGMIGYTIEADEYVVFRFEEKFIGDFWDYFCNPANQNKYNLNIDKPRFEIFRSDLQPQGVTEIYFPTNDRSYEVSALGKLHLVGIRVRCEDGEAYAAEIPKAFAELERRLYEIPDRVEPARLIGAFFVSDEAEEEDGYWACVEVNESALVPDGMTSVTVPPQTYAVTVHRGRTNQLFRTYERLHQWIGEQGFGRNLRSWHIEVYREHASAAGGPVEISLYDTIVS
jgi:predicted transcriptional regulator YdeE